MRVLLTNDDGVGADGLTTLRHELIGHGIVVVVVAPDRDCSGFARACTWRTPVEVTRLLGGDNPIYACAGTPTDCVRAGLLGGVGGGVDLVVSGINNGANLGDDVFYSGTVSAGLEADLLGVPALCLSLHTGSPGVLEQVAGPAAYVSAARLAARMTSFMPTLSGGRPCVLNANFPSGADQPAVRLTSLARKVYVRGSLSPTAKQHDRASYATFPESPTWAPSHDPLPTDVEVVEAGHVSLTALRSASVRRSAAASSTRRLARALESWSS